MRAVGEPDRLFDLVGRALRKADIIDLDPLQFAAQRRWAYLRAKERRRPGDPTLDDIYREIRVAIGWSTPTTSQAMLSELEMERRLIRKWIPGLDLLRCARASGSRICFTSDTYLSESFVTDLLDLHVERRSDELVVTSAGRNSSKQDGSLFEVVCGYLGASPDEVLHVGNNRDSDIKSATEYGIRSHYISCGNLNIFEECLEDYSLDSGSLTSLFAGAARLTRSELSERCHRLNLTPETAAIVAGVFGPTVTAFVLWCLREADRHGLERLYFLAREGDPLLKVARVLRQRLPGPDVRYLHVSRQAINLAAFEIGEQGGLDWLLTDAEFDSLPNFLARLGLDLDDGPVLACLRRNGLSVGAPQQPAIVNALIRGVSDDQDGLARLVVERATERRSQAIRYLSSVGFFDAVPIGLVDVAGVGSQLRSLASLRDVSVRSLDRGLLFSRYRPPVEGVETHLDLSIDGYFGDEAKDTGFLTYPFVAALLELACASIEGTVLGYLDDGVGSCLPELGPGRDGSEAELQRFVQAGLERFATNLSLECADSSVLAGDARMAVYRLMQRLWREPSPGEALALAGFRLEVGSGPVERRSMVSPRRLREFVPPGGQASEAQPWFYWHEGSLLLSHPVLRLVRRLKVGTQRILKRHRR